MRRAYLMTATSELSSFAISGRAGMSEPETKTFRRAPRDHVIARLVRVVRESSGKKSRDRTENKTRPCDECDDSQLATR